LKRSRGWWPIEGAVLICVPVGIPSDDLHLLRRLGCDRSGDRSARRGARRPPVSPCDLTGDPRSTAQHYATDGGQQHDLNLTPSGIRSRSNSASPAMMVRMSMALRSMVRLV